MITALSAVFYGLASALTWGAGDFSGGLASRRSNVYAVIILSQIVGVTLLAALAIVFAEPVPRVVDLIWGGAAGLAGSVGLVALYRGLAAGQMGIVAPVSAIVTAGVPVLVGIAWEGLPAPRILLAFVLGLAAIWLISRYDASLTVRLKELALPVSAGLGFALFLIIIDRVSEQAIFWPLVAARLASITTLTLLTGPRGRLQMPSIDALPLIALTGLLESGGNAFYALAARAGRLDVAAVLASLYPTATVFLAWLLLKERLARHQWLGVVIALVAVLLIASA